MAEEAPGGDELEKLIKLSGDELFTILGGTKLDWSEQVAAAVETWAPDGIGESLKSEGLFGVDAVDLIERGRVALNEIVTKKREQLTEALCSRYKKAAERELILDAAPICTDGVAEVAHVGHPAALGLAAAILLVRYGLEKLCSGDSSRD